MQLQQRHSRLAPTNGGRNLGLIKVAPTRQHYRYAPTHGRRGLGFLEIAAGISSIIATGAGAAVKIYGTIEQTKLAKEAAELQNQLAERRFALEEELSQAQQRIFAVQTKGIEARQDIDLQIAVMQSEVLQQQLEKVKRRQELQAEIDEMRLQRELEMEEERYRLQQQLYQQR